jgi:hypothetical protein
MTWLQFFTSVIGSLAWPAAVVIALFVVRTHLGQLFERLLELHLPGGTKAVFRDALAKGSEVIKQIEMPQQQETTLTPKKEITAVASGERDPLVMIIQAYAEVEERLKVVRERLHIRPIYGPKFVMDVLKNRNLVAPEVVELFDSLRAARNSAAHGRLQPTDNEANEYVKQAEVFKEIVTAATNDLR